ncbi:MAG: LysR family transcriptional regulator [Luteitalea sp.]|nr:LysR family transcriptional regulator [Luteitalea sp.]
MDLRDLKTFLVVAEERSFVRAAERLGCSQPAVTFAVQRLEASVHQPLFLRRAKPPDLTDAGRILLDYARRLCRIRQEATFAMADLRGAAHGALRLGLNDSFVPFVVSVLDRFGLHHPGVRVELRRGRSVDLVAGVSCGDLHGALFSFAPPNRHLSAVPLGRDRIVLVTAPSHPLAAKACVCLDDLAAERLIAHSEPSSLRALVLKTCDQRGLSLQMTALLPTLEAMKQAVTLGMGVTILPLRTVLQDIAEGRLRGIPIAESWAEEEIWFAHSGEHALPAVGQVFVELLRELSEKALAPCSPVVPRSRHPTTIAVARAAVAARSRRASPHRTAARPSSRSG